MSTVRLMRGMLLIGIAAISLLSLVGVLMRIIESFLCSRKKIPMLHSMSRSFVYLCSVILLLALVSLF